jgi:hypothetical protein
MLTVTTLTLIVLVGLAHGKGLSSILSLAFQQDPPLWSSCVGWRLALGNHYIFLTIVW